MGNICMRVKEITIETQCILDLCDGCSTLCNSSDLTVLKEEDYETKLCPYCKINWLNQLI